MKNENIKKQTYEDLLNYLETETYVNSDKIIKYVPEVKNGGWGNSGN
jgi:hypothetical protein